MSSQIDKEWLKHPISFDDAVAKILDPNLGVIESHRNKQRLLPQLEQLYQSLREKDQVWWFHSNDGRKLPIYYSGFAIVRNGQIIEGILQTIHVSY